MNNTIVVAVSAISGGGKTTLVNKCKEMLDCEVMFFDDYFTAEFYPKDFDKWLKEGADLTSWNAPLFTKDLLRLKRGEEVKSSVNEKVYYPKKLIVIEEPTGRERPEIASLIDYVVVIDTPPAISLARRINRYIKLIPADRLAEAPKEALVEEFSKFLNHYRGYLDNYERNGYEGYVTILNRVKQHCDLILDWQLTIEDMVLKLVDEFNLRESYKEE